MNLSDFTPDKAFTPMFSCKDFLHSYIICGPATSGKAALAETLAAAMVCSGIGLKPCGRCAHCKKSIRGIHPDITIVDRAPGKRDIQVDRMRDVRSDAVIMPNEADKKVYIIKNADSMNTAAQNAMLKVFEEPPSHAAFILIAKNPSVLLPTVRSRCAELRLTPPESGIPSKTTELVEKFYVSLQSGPLKIAEFTSHLEKLDKLQLAEFTAAAKETAAEKLRESLTGVNTGFHPKYMMIVISALDRASEYLEFNVATGHISGMLCAMLIDTEAWTSGSMRNEEI